VSRRNGCGHEKAEFSVRRSLTSVAVAALVVAACTSGTSPDRSSSASPAVTSSSPAPTSAGPSPSPVPAGRIAFGTFDPALGGFLIYTARPDGSDVKQLLPDAHECPAWSPDSTEIAITAGANGAFATIVHGDGTNPRTLKLADPNMALGCAVWSPDGKQLALEGWDITKLGAEGVYLVNASDGGGLKRLTSPLGGIHDGPISFSPDGKELFFMRTTDPNAEAGEVWLVNRDGSQPRRVAERYLAHGAGLSRDGRWLAIVAANAVLMFDVADLAAPPKRIDIPAGYGANGVGWSPDDTRFVLGLFQPGISRPNVFTMNVDGTDLWQVTHTTQESSFGTWGLPPG
jgi:Tol biopolymer transport system component